MHIYILGLKLLRWTFLQISQTFIRSGTHKLFRRFLDISQFLTAISRKLWCQLATKMRTTYCIWKKKQSIPKKALKTASKTTHKLSHNTCLNYVPHARGRLRTKKTPIFAPTAGARSSISPKQTLHADRERRDNSKRVVNHFFSIQRIVLPAGAKMLIFGHWLAE